MLGHAIVPNMWRAWGRHQPDKGTDTEAAAAIRARYDVATYAYAWKSFEVHQAEGMRLEVKEGDGS